MKNIIKIGLLSLVLSGCSTASISNSGYSKGNANQRSHYNNILSNELDEIQVLGLEDNDVIEKSNIAELLDNAKGINLRKGDSILLIQSGAEFPDSEMVESLSDIYDISTFSGTASKYSERKLNQLLRYSAATGGSSHIVVYWGMVESAERSLGSKSVSWVPFVGWSLPDESTQIRIRLKFAIIDVATGSWKTYQPTPIEEEFTSSIMGREGQKQQKIIELKKLVYASAAKQLHQKFGNE